MGYLKKWYIVLLVAAITITSFESCSYHHRFKKMLRHRRSVNVRRFHSPYQRRIRKKIVPINKNYVIKRARHLPANLRK